MEIRCPAGEIVNDTERGPSCRCRIAHETLTPADNPKSLAMWCAAAYTGCPTWRRQRDAEAADEHRKLRADIERTTGRPTPVAV
jgi:hypothetical protein